MSNTIRVPVQNPDGSPAMPTKSSRAKRWVQQDKAVEVRNDLEIYGVRLLSEPSGKITQDIALGIDPGKLLTGIGLVSAKATLFKAHLQLPFKSVTKKMTARRILRRARRGRRINRKLPHNQRCHRQKRFDNRRQKKLVPSIRANKQMELRVVKELLKFYPVSHIVYERIEARGTKSFSPAMVGQKIMVEWLSELRPTTTQLGWQTSNLRQWLGLAKDKANKAKPTPETHSHDGIALAASHFIKWQDWVSNKARGGHWVGEIELTKGPFAVISRPQLYRRQLHFENPVKGSPIHPEQTLLTSLTLRYRKRKGGTVTPFGLRSGDKVKAEKAGQSYIGWIGGYVEKQKKVSVYDINWHRIGQFSVSKVQLVKRSTKLLSYVKVC
ncbi:MAG TPA: RRXRR domain-containing protein [Leptolyngbyaceae cyanobacterium]